MKWQDGVPFIRLFVDAFDVLFMTRADNLARAPKSAKNYRHVKTSRNLLYGNKTQTNTTSAEINQRWRF